MYQMNECWSEFYRETDPDKRQELYDAIIQEQEDDGANAFRKEFMDQRYTHPAKPGKKVDNFLWNILILPGYLRPMYLVRAAGEREIQGSVRELGLENAQDWDEAKRAAAYWEYRNAAKRYLATCNSPNYGKKLFGIMQSTDEEKLAKTARDFYATIVTVPAKYEREEEMELFTRALKDEFLSSSPEARRAWEYAKLNEKKIIWR